MQVNIRKLVIQKERHKFYNEKRKLPSSLGLVSWKCLVDSGTINANPRARHPPQSNGNLQNSIVQHPPLLPTCRGGNWGAGGLWGMWEEVGRGGGCLTMHNTTFRFPMDYHRFCRWICVYISIIYKAFQKTSH